MEFKLINVPEPLQGYIKSIWYLDTGFEEEDRGFSSVHTQPILPLAGSMLFFHRSAKPLMINGKELPTTAFHGPHTKAFDLVTSGNIRILGMELYPLTACVLFRRSYRELGLDPLSPEELNDEMFQEIAKKACKCYDYNNLLSSVLKMVQDKVDSFDFNDLKYRSVKNVITAIGKGTASSAFKDLSISFGLSQKTMQRYFHDLIGITPKEFEGIMRFNTAVEAIRSCQTKDKIYDIALDCGYSNTSQMIKDFKNRGALSPNTIKYLDSLTPEEFNLFHYSRSMLDQQREGVKNITR